MGRERPSGTVTFLFTEIGDSAQRPEDAATDMAAALQVHDAVLRDAIESQSGYVFATDGDCLSAVFSTATDAVTAAVAAQQSLAEAAIPFGVRMGPHTGEAIAVHRHSNGDGAGGRAASVTACFHYLFRASFLGAADQVSTALGGGRGMRVSPRGTAEGT